MGLLLGGGDYLILGAPCLGVHLSPLLSSDKGQKHVCTVYSHPSVHLNKQARGTRCRDYVRLWCLESRVTDLHK